MSLVNRSSRNVLIFSLICSITFFKLNTFFKVIKINNNSNENIALVLLTSFSISSKKAYGFNKASLFANISLDNKRKYAIHNNINYVNNFF